MHDRDWIHRMIFVGRCEIQAAFMTHIGSNHFMIFSRQRREGKT